MEVFKNDDMFKNQMLSSNEIDKFINEALTQKPVEPTEQEFISLCKCFQAQYSQLPNLITISQLITVVGSIHGQFDDLLEIFDIYGKPPYTCYLFLGNFANYGPHNILTIVLLFSLAIKYPIYFYLLRGPHESRQMTRECGLFEEIINLYGSPRAWEYLMTAFDSLPLAAVCDSFFFVSGGIAKSISSLSQINSFNRFTEISLNNAWSELIFNVPNKGVQDFKPLPQKIGFYYGQQPLDSFLKANDLKYLVYSKRLCPNGYDTSFSENCINLWSAPKFLGWMQNEGAVLQIVSHESNHNYFIHVFRARPESERLCHSSRPTHDISSLERIYFTSDDANPK